MNRTASKQLYTLVLDLRGGTYVSQSEAFSVQEAILDWIERVDWNAMLVRMTPAIRRNLRAQTLELGYSALQGLESAWCASPRIGAHMGTLNIIATRRGRKSSAKGHAPRNRTPA